MDIEYEDYIERQDAEWADGNSLPLLIG
jgi:hypothetical protein